MKLFVALSFLAALSAANPPKAPVEFVALSTIDPTILHDIRYITPHNFIGVPITGYKDPLCILTRPAALALRRAQKALRRTGHSLKVYDCFRPQRAVDHFVRWATDLNDTLMAREFYPAVAKTRLFADGYIAARSGHSRGSTVDLTIVKLPAKRTRRYVPGEPLVECTNPSKRARFPDNSVDMGTGYDCFDTLSWPTDPRPGARVQRNRRLLAEVLAAQGFVPLETEWWHFTHKPEVFNATYFDFEVAWESLQRWGGHGGGSHLYGE
ncbi:D-alanyl-D-alanine dipeptidase [Geopyxis carbonaria]|nr:D-alanyl-D-alanine dipeptidase [Geopyxis carbonaria]